MKSSSAQSGDVDIIKTTQTKTTTKKSTKSRAKSTKSSAATAAAATTAAAAAASSPATEIPSGSSSSVITHSASGKTANIPPLTVINMVNAPTTPTHHALTSASAAGSAFDSGGGGGGGYAGQQVNGGQGFEFVVPTKNPQKSYAGLEPRSIKCIWEQHNQSDMELQPNACIRLAEDVSYKLWEVINNIKIYSRHSGGVVTYDLVNEVLRDMDVPPALGAMDSDWDRIDYDGSYFFHTDKILELRDEYQKEESILMPNDLDIVCTQPLDDKNMEAIKKYVPSLIYIILYGDSSKLDTALYEVAFSPIIGAVIRLLLTKVIQLLAFKQSDTISKRCWCLLRACSANPHTKHLIYREEYFHLAEVLICQLLAPYESIKQKSQNTQDPANAEQTTTQQSDTTIKMEVEDNKLDIKPDLEFFDSQQSEQQQSVSMDDDVTFSNDANELDDEKGKNFRLKLDNNDSDDGDDNGEQLNASAASEQTPQQFSSYFASPVDAKYVDDLCLTIGLLAAENCFFQRECIFHITRRLERFFEGRTIGTEKDYLFIGRSVRGLIALGENAFKEIIPYLYKLDIEALPESLCREFLHSAVFLKGRDDIFLYEFMEHICGADKLQPFLLYYAHFHDRLLLERFKKRKPPSYKIVPKQSVRRLEWNTLAAAMCHGDDPNRSLKPKPTLNDVFPDLRVPNLQLNRSGTIRFKFAGCRPVILKKTTATGSSKHSKSIAHSSNTTQGSSRIGTTTSNSTEPMLINDIGQSDILIARRKLYKPLTNDRYVKSPVSSSLSSYYFISI